MKILKTILIILSVIIVVFTLFSWYIGLFTKVEVEEKVEGGYTVVGKEFVGQYAKAGKFMKDVDNELTELGITSTKGFGIYYDNPRTVAPEKCRSFVGNILEEKDYGRIDELQSKGFKVDTIPTTTSVIAYFPIKSDMSYMIGPIKVYPELSKYISDNGYKVTSSIEIYDVPNKKILYIMQYK